MTHSTHEDRISITGQVVIVHPSKGNFAVVPNEGITKQGTKAGEKWAPILRPPMPPKLADPRQAIFLLLMLRTRLSSIFLHFASCSLECIDY